jgi:hypothetical protein
MVNYEARTVSVLCNSRMLEELRDDAANGDFHNKWGSRVAVVQDVTGIAWRLVSAVSTSVEKSLVLLTGVVEVLGAAAVVLAALSTAREHLSGTCTARVKLAHAKFGSTMFARNQLKKNMTRQMSISVTIFVLTTSQKVASTLALSSAISVKSSSRSSHVGNPWAMTSLAAS